MPNQTPLETLAPPVGPDAQLDTRIADADAASRIVTALEKEDLPRAKTRTTLRGMLDGNPPYDPQELRRLGQGYRSNVNFRESEGHVNARKTSYSELVLEVPELVTVIPDPLKAEGIPTAYGQVVAEEFDRTLRAWDGFLFNTMQKQSEMVIFGVGITCFPDEFDWRFKAVQVGDFLVPPKAPANVDGLELAVIRHKYRVSDLYGYIRTPEKAQYAQDAGWDVSAIKRAITHAYDTRGSLRDTPTPWESIQQKLKNNDLVEGYTAVNPVPAHVMLWREFDGTVSMGILYNRQDKPDFLYRARGRFKTFSEVLNMFVSEIGDGTYHSIRGLMAKIFPTCEVTDRFSNTLVDGAMLASTVLLTTPNTGRSAVPKVNRVGPLTVLPENFQAIQGGFKPDLQGVIGVKQLLTGTLNNNVGLFRPDTDQLGDSRGPERTARDVSAQAIREARLEKADINFYYQQWDRLYREILRRLLAVNYPREAEGYAEAMDFRKRCKARGVPSTFLKIDALQIKATRAVGLGSPVMRDFNSRELLALAPYLGPEGKKAAIYNRAVVLAGASNAARFMPPDREESLGDEVSLAKAENNLIELGKPALAAPEEDHVTHAAMHGGLVSSIVQGGQQLLVNQQATATQLSATLQLGVEHLGQHLEAMNGNPAMLPELERGLTVFKDGQKYLRQLAFAVKDEERAAQQQQEQQATAWKELQARADQTQVKLAEVQVDGQIKAMKEDNRAAIAEQKLQRHMAIEQARMEAQTALQEQQVRINAGLEVMRINSKRAIGGAQ
jgi:hypothetical protein